MNNMSRRLINIVSLALVFSIFVGLLPINALRADVNAHGEYHLTPFEVAYEQNSTWNNTTQGSFTVTNVSDNDISTWKFEIEYLYPVTVSNIWDAVLVGDASQSSSTITVSNTNNGYIAAGNSVSFGVIVQGEDSAPVAPISVRLVTDNSEVVNPSENLTPIPTITEGIIEYFPYVIFSGSSSFDFIFNGWKSDILGDVYTGTNFQYNGSELTLDGTAKSVGSINVGGWNINITNQEENVDSIDMPDWGCYILARENELPAIDTSRFTSEDPIQTDGYCYVDGDIVISGTTFEGDAIIVASGDITYNINEISGDGRVLLYSENGDITINGTEIDLNGILYAPNGRVSISAYSTTVNGRIVADEIFFSGSILDCYASIDDLNMFYPDIDIIVTPSPADDIVPTVPSEGTPSVTPSDDSAVVIELDTSPFLASECEGLYYVLTYIENVEGTLVDSSLVESFTYSISSVYEDNVASGDLPISDHWSTEDIGFFFGPTKLILTAITYDGETYIKEYVFFSYTYLNADRLNVDIVSDTDSDGLPDYFENEIGTNPNIADSDNDGLTDFEEIYMFVMNPINPDTDGDGMLDGDEDADCDGVSNSRELQLGTNPGNEDTDGDNLTDYEEVSIHLTNPNESDSDGDGLSDGDEVTIGKNPLDALDADTAVYQTVTVLIDNTEDSAITAVDISMWYSGNLKKVVQVLDLYNVDTYSTDAYGRLGSPLGLYACIDFDTAVLTIHYDDTSINGASESNLGVLWFDEDSVLYVEQTQAEINEEDNAVTLELSHFSTYILVDLDVWNNPIDPDYSDFIYVAHSEMNDYGCNSYVPTQEYLDNEAWWWWSLTRNNVERLATLKFEAIHTRTIWYDFHFDWLVLDTSDSNENGVPDYIEEVGVLGTNHHYYSYESISNRLGQRYLSMTGQRKYIYFAINRAESFTDDDYDGLYSGEARYNAAGEVIVPADSDDNFPNAPMHLIDTHCLQVYDGRNVATSLVNSRVGYISPYNLDIYGSNSGLSDAGNLWLNVITFDLTSQLALYDLTFFEYLSYLGCYYLWFYDDNLGQAAHSDDHQWQRHLGYCDSYDILFDMFTNNNMRSLKLWFPYDDTTFVFWGWRGSYLNLGTGGELGLYCNPSLGIESLALWEVSNYTIDMELHIYTNENVVYENVLNWAPDDNQWWITGFNYHEEEWNPSVSNIYMIATINFNDIELNGVEIENSEMYGTVRRAWEEIGNTNLFSIIFDDLNKTVYIIFGDNLTQSIH